VKRERRRLVLKVEHVVRLPFVRLIDTDHHGVLNHASIHEIVEAAAEKDACSKGCVAAKFLFLAPLRGGQVLDVDEWSGGLDFALLVDGIEGGSVHASRRRQRERVLLIKDFLGRAPYNLVRGHRGVAGLIVLMPIADINFFDQEKRFFVAFFLFLVFLLVSFFYCLVGFVLSF